MQHFWTIWPIKSKRQTIAVFGGTCDGRPILRASIIKFALCNSSMTKKAPPLNLLIFMLFYLFPFTLMRSLFDNRHLVGFKNILRSIECYGIASVHGINYFGRGLLSSDKYVDYIRHDILGKDLLNTTINYVPSVKAVYKSVSTMPTYESLRNK